MGLPILWGVGAFLFMWYGLNRKNRQLRIVSLSVFALTLVKLFLFDIRGISEGGKIAAFISLGVLLLTISFMYQRIRKLILADEANCMKKAPNSCVADNEGVLRRSFQFQANRWAGYPNWLSAD